jgi:Asp-tRNA(Asn)/Glu-tRNA(Gln) amidotransferase A subunit family amidase
VREAIARATLREPDLHAWASLNEVQALREAAALDLQPRRGVLHGIPIAVKDLSDTRTHPTSYGSPAYLGHKPMMDAACVALARAAGAVILGKTATVEFGASRPCATTNPHNKNHTPGGSSAGSAAVVGDHQVLLATGTQTGGSIIRPAAFCGAVGFKPSFGSVSTAGTKGYAWSLDTVGAFASRVEDAALFFSVLRGIRNVEMPQPLSSPPRIGLLPGPFADRAEEPAVEALEAVARRCSFAGAQVHPADWPSKLEESLELQRTISRYEMGRSLLAETQSPVAGELGAPLMNEVTRGQTITEQAYLDAKRKAATLASAIDLLFMQYDALLSFATPGEAPHGLNTTGDATFCLSWSLLGLPCLSLPVGVGPGGLPLAVQVVGRKYHDDQLLQIARWIEQLITNPT